MSQPIYAITLKKTRGVPRVSDYEDYLAWLRENSFEVMNVNYEVTRGLHIHFVLSSEEEGYPNIKKEPHGWHIKCVPIWDRDGWVAYSEKDKSKDLKIQQILTELHEEAPYPHNLHH